MAEDLNKKIEELQEEQLDEVSGGVTNYGRSIKEAIENAKRWLLSNH